MDGGTLNSSSEDEFDVYVNSVALLKALQTKNCTNPDDTLNTDHNKETLKEKKQAVKRRSGRRRRNIENSSSTRNREKDLEIVSVQEDLEIVSVQDRNNDILICDDIDRTADNPIVLNSSDEDTGKYENYDVNVKVLWQSKVIHRLNIHNHDNFTKVFQHFADMENVPINQILITKKDKRINITDTPSSIGLSIIDILEGGIIDAKLIAQNKDQSQRNAEENMCQIKVQTLNKKSLTIPLKKDQPFKVLIANCARQLDVSESSIKLYFDGEAINVDDTPESLDIEEEACIDLCISKQ